MTQTEEKTKVIVSFIKSPSANGALLCKEFKEWISGYIQQKATKENVAYELSFHDIVEELTLAKKEPTLADSQFLTLYACFASDIVVFDGSIESNDFSQYRFAYETMKKIDYALIVSRTEMPYNYEGTRRGGAPSWIQIGEIPEETNDDTDAAFNNKFILSWLQHIVPQLELPRSDRLSGMLNMENVLSVTGKTLRNSDERMSIVEKENPSLFISYLSRDYSILKQYFSEISDRTRIPASQFNYFAPGRVAKELMSERRRWEIVSITDHILAKSSAFVIFETNGYRKSWWTMGEIMSISYRYRSKWNECPTIYIAKILNEVDGQKTIQWRNLETPEEKKAYFPEITEQQMRRLARRFVSADPNEAAYELDDKMVRQDKQPEWFKKVRATGKGVLMYALEQTGALDELFQTDGKPDTPKGSLREAIARANESELSYTHTNDYLTKRILECPCCREMASDLTIENFIALDMPYVYQVDDCELKLDENGKLFLHSPCPKHKDIIYLHKRLSYSRFIQPRRGKLMGKNKTLLESVERIEII